MRTQEFKDRRMLEADYDLFVSLLHSETDAKFEAEKSPRLPGEVELKRCRVRFDPVERSMDSDTRHLSDEEVWQGVLSRCAKGGFETA